ncbi:hypothetical protein FNF27_01570 [Cafeteria roenbergensis]|uniref:ATPase V1 complex subunit H C-terminal domain-containing protein n=1 Tax=Cafeteria roenbergensis TaxID=33653 RepID=A0A5A8EHL3_CAFRO|nr:hypothetical protein FNF27_01570 [Cafeteria roenbergensis]
MAGSRDALPSFPTDTEVLRAGLGVDWSSFVAAGAAQSGRHVLLSPDDGIALSDYSELQGEELFESLQPDGDDAARETYPPALARVLSRLTDPTARRFAVARLTQIAVACPEAAADVFGPAFFPSRSAVMTAWEGRPSHSAAALDAVHLPGQPGTSLLAGQAPARRPPAGAGAAAGEHRAGSRPAPREKSLRELDLERLGYDYAEAAADAAARAAEPEGAGPPSGPDGSASCAGEALSALLSALPSSLAEVTDGYMAVRASALLARVVANSALACRPSPAISAEQGEWSVPRALASAAVRLLGWSRTILGSADATRAIRGTAAYAVVDAAISAVAVAARSQWLRLLFHADEGVGVLLPFLSSEDGERAYKTVLALWTLSLERECRSEMDSEDAIHRLCSLVSPQTRKPKVVRVAVATLASIAADPEAASDAVPLMAETHLSASLSLVLSRETDEEVAADAKALLSSLAANHRVLSSLERYDRELATHRLTRSPVHSTGFWRENYAEFEAGGCRRLRALGSLMEAGLRAAEAEAEAERRASAHDGDEEGEGEGHHLGGGGGAQSRGGAAGARAGSADGASLLADADAKAGSAGAGLVARARAGSSTGRNFPPLAVNPSVTTLAVAVADVGEFAAAHPNGRYIAQRLGLTELVMTMLSHKASDVKRAALLATSKLMLAQWSFVEGMRAAARR